MAGVTKMRLIVYAKTRNGRRHTMVELWKKRLSNLLCVKSIVTIILTLVFAFLAVTGQVASGDFLTIFSVIIAFYFDTQSQRLNDRIEKSDGQSNQPKES